MSPQLFTYALLAATSLFGAIYAAPIAPDDDALFSRATWGTGKYTIDLTVYHSQVKPVFLKEFRAHNEKFESLCGSNPDFEITRKGDVSPSPVDSKKKQLGKCTKSTFTLNLGDVVLSHIPRSRSPSPARRSVHEYIEELYRRATWGTGKYTVDLSLYHSEIKPVFLKEFKASNAKFESLCGSNPDFEITRKGEVSPSPVDAKKKQLGKCTKSAFTLDLGAIVLSHIPRSRSPSPARRSVHEYIEELYRRATWGTGKYTVDLSLYHSEIKPVFLKEFKASNAKFESLCGSNPDFEITRKGEVSPSPVDAKKKQLGKCTKSSFTLDLGHIVLAHIPKSRSPSPAPAR
ncbi:uncharacterized protein LACBIDRAFT_294757 [Laccaria bicolor S238N-H82]|uniref:Predicted protein n=1 Tax=Laccaria bicolor (strain S238N-H82 / ATCC MYA-4686) TaxID=486041 RepID=B0DHK3_LACBS|nr:uncharacterized protein LACBIDRAFT_294757 [Laccaria bicolor S238N-H82]EDR05740.1 predicted protein [Laccaria bicolor S238N-H82]|eukprot:XP_001883416.1 predicted protein [Laccaria bicolor S238N-H82]